MIKTVHFLVFCLLSGIFFTAYVNGPTVRFALISDTHFGNPVALTKIPQLLKVLLSKKSVVDAIISTGQNPIV